MASESLLQKLSEIPMDVRPGVAEALWDQLRSQFGAAEIRRVRGLLDCWAGVRAKPLRAQQEAVYGLYFPDLEHDDPWLDPSLFKIAAELEASFGEIRDEYDRLQRARPFKAYGRGPDDPDTGPLPGNLDGWKEFALIHQFQPLRANCAQVPVTSRFVERALAYHSIVAQFTFLTLHPGTVIAPHCDTANFLVSCHLGLVVPPGCSLTVGGEERSWVEGKCLAFNNSYRHHAANKGTAVRAILSIHALHPALREVERTAIGSLIKALGRI